MTGGFRHDATLEQSGIATVQDTQVAGGVDDRAVSPLERVLADAAELFEAHLWESPGRAARGQLAAEGLEEKTIRDFRVGYAPMGPEEMLNHLRGLGHSDEELVEAGLATRSVRGRIHARFRSRIIFPVTDLDGRVVGFAGRGTHVGPSWSLWVTSPPIGLYHPSEVVFGLDRAAKAIAASGVARVEPDCIEVLLAHQEGRANTVTVHTGRVTRDQQLAIAAGVPGGIEALELEVAPGMRADSVSEPAGPAAVPPEAMAPSTGGPSTPDSPRLRLQKLAIVAATAFLGTMVWTAVPLLALWVGAQAQGGKVLSATGVLTVLAVMTAAAFLFAAGLAWLSGKYNELTGRPQTAGQTSLWTRSMRDEHPRDVFARWAIIERHTSVPHCIIAGVIVFQVWFFFFAGSSLPGA